VRDGRDEIVLELVEAKESRRVLEDDGGARDRARLVVDGRRARQEDALAVRRASDAHGLLETLGHVRALAAEDVRAQALEDRAHAGIGVGVHLARGPLGIDREQARRGRVDAGQRTARVEQQHGVGQAVDGGLRGLLRLQELAEGARAVALEAVGHAVEFDRDPPRSRRDRARWRAP